MNLAFTSLISLLAFMTYGCEENVRKNHARKYQLSSSLKDSYLGQLHVNSCMKGASYLVYNDKQYAFGSKTVVKLREMISTIGRDQVVAGEQIASSGCEKIYRIEFQGEFEKENALTGYNSDEVRQVVQVYQFRLL